MQYGYVHSFTHKYMQTIGIRNKKPSFDEYAWYRLESFWVWCDVLFDISGVTYITRSGVDDQGDDKKKTKTSLVTTLVKCTKL